MRSAPAAALALALLVAGAGPASGQEAGPEPAGESRGTPWDVSFGVYGFDPPDDDAYASAILRADRGALHLEARYQYEDLDSASFFVGRNFVWADELSVLVVPMIGAVAGDTDGVAPGLEYDLAWKALEWYGESEYVYDLHDADDSFFYTWNELTLAPAEWLRFGLVAQRTRVFEQELTLDRGLLLGLAYGSLWLDLYLFNPDQDDAYVGVALGFGG
ncbi:MAG: hypothetical protein EYC70_06085 [Planctomycetota bacterium]|nr:MAG: hypothetical protein EYC70_06085 [Planctomycetota bacterium]